MSRADRGAEIAALAGEGRGEEPAAGLQGPEQGRRGGLDHRVRQEHLRQEREVVGGALVEMLDALAADLDAVLEAGRRGRAAPRSRPGRAPARGRSAESAGKWRHRVIDRPAAPAPDVEQRGAARLEPPHEAGQEHEPRDRAPPPTGW